MRIDASRCGADISSIFWSEYNIDAHLEVFDTHPASVISCRVEGRVQLS